MVMMSKSRLELAPTLTLKVLVKIRLGQNLPFTPSGALAKQISSLPSDVHKTKKLSFDEYMNISKGHQILM